MIQLRVKEKHQPPQVVNFSTVYTPLGEVHWHAAVGKDNHVLIAFPEASGGLVLPDGRVFVTELNMPVKWFYGAGFTLSYSGNPIREVKKNSKLGTRLKFENPDLTFLSDYIKEQVEKNIIPVRADAGQEIIAAYDNRDEIQKLYAEFKDNYTKLRKLMAAENAKVEEFVSGVGREEVYPVISVKTPDIYFS